MRIRFPRIRFKRIAARSLLFAGYAGNFFGKWGAADVALCALLLWVLLWVLLRVLLDIGAHPAQRRWQTGPLESLLRRFKNA